MARIVVTGGGGFLGQRVVRSLLSMNRFAVNGVDCELSSLCVVDRFIPPSMRGMGVEVIEGDLLSLLQSQPERIQSSDVVFHLASAVSGECEQDLTLGLSEFRNRDRARSDIGFSQSSPASGFFEFIGDLWWYQRFSSTYCHYGRRETKSTKQLWCSKVDA